jgi:hypothetical protein
MDSQERRKVLKFFEDISVIDGREAFLLRKINVILKLMFFPALNWNIVDLKSKSFTQYLINSLTL